MSDPVSFATNIAARYRRSVWLDGGGARDWSGRRSIIGWLDDADPSLSYCAARGEVTLHQHGRAEVVGENIFDVLQTQLREGDSDASWFGYFGYACRNDLPATPAAVDDLPDAIWMRPSSVQVFHHKDVAQSARSARRPSGAGDPQVPNWYGRAFNEVQEHLHAGNSYEVNLTFRDEVTSDIDPFPAYLQLRTLNPAPYSGFLQHDQPGARGWLLSSSPERFATINNERWLETKPIKGTTARGVNPVEDEALATHLATDPKFRGENLMIVDLLRHDLASVCAAGTVTVPGLMVVESYPSVHQLVSTVRGRLREDISTVAALRALFPAGSMTGAPKLRTMQIIDQVEETPRGAYAGAFGWVSARGPADLGVVIRSITTPGDRRYRFGTGGGITVRSQVEEEYDEAVLKTLCLRAGLDP